MQKSEFEIVKMDCPSEENLIRMKLQNLDVIVALHFNIPKRRLDVIHDGKIAQIVSAIDELRLGSKLISSKEVVDYAKENESSQRKSLWIVLFINFLFFIIEMSTGIISKSMGLVADSLDMLADSIVYGLSLIAVGGTIALKSRIATVAGYFQMSLAVLGFAEVVRRFVGVEQMPDFKIMIFVSLFALLANIICLVILQRSKSNEAHMRASMIFTSNDIIINLGVILAGLLVLRLDSSMPDLIIGAIVFVLVVQGAFRILKLGK